MMMNGWCCIRCSFLNCSISWAYGWVRSWEYYYYFDLVQFTISYLLIWKYIQLNNIETPFKILSIFSRTTIFYSLTHCFDLCCLDVLNILSCFHCFLFMFSLIFNCVFCTKNEVGDGDAPHSTHNVVHIVHYLYLVFVRFVAAVTYWYLHENVI